MKSQPIIIALILSLVLCLPLIACETKATAAVTSAPEAQKKESSLLPATQRGGGDEALAPPANDNFANPTVLVGVNGVATSTNVDATKEAGEPNHADNVGGKSVWYIWNAPLTYSVTFGMEQSFTNFDTLLAVYTGASVNALTPVASNDDYGNTSRSSLTFPAVQGTTYFIAVDGFGGESGNLRITFGVNSINKNGTGFIGPSNDITIFRPSNGLWASLNSPSQTKFAYFGQPGDVPAAADYDGDGKSDYAVFRQGVWYILYSSTSTFLARNWGASGDIPVMGDYGGNGKADLAVYRPSTGYWYVANTALFTLITAQWGQAGDKPVQLDYDGDGRIDLAVFRPSTGYWYIRRSTDGALRAIAWGQNGDIPVPGDYGNQEDGKADVAVFRPSTGTWYVLASINQAIIAVNWGTSGDIPQPMNAVINGSTNSVSHFVVYRPSTRTWHLLNSRTLASTESIQWGAPGDIPVSASYIVQP